MHDRSAICWLIVEQKAHEFEHAAPDQPMLDVLDDRAFEVELTALARSSPAHLSVRPVSRQPALRQVWAWQIWWQAIWI
jgi:hypothetical protein